MFGWVRLLLVGFAVLSVLYVILSVRARVRCRRKLEREFDAGGINGTREAYIEAGMHRYDHSLGKKLLLGVYLVPLAGLIALIYVMNFM